MSFNLSPNSAPTLRFVRAGHQSLTNDPDFEEMISGIRHPKRTTKIIEVVKSFLFYVGMKPDSPHLCLLTAEDFFVMGEALPGTENLRLKGKLIEKIKELIEKNVLAFTMKKSEQQTLLQLVESPKIENARDLFKKTGAKIEALCANPPSTSVVSSSLEIEMEKFGTPFLEIDIALQFLQRAGQVTVDEIAQNNELQLRVNAIFAEFYTSFNHVFYPPGKSPAWLRVYNILRTHNVPTTPTTFSSTEFFPKHVRSFSEASDFSTRFIGGSALHTPSTACSSVSFDDTRIVSSPTTSDGSEGSDGTLSPATTSTARNSAIFGRSRSNTISHVPSNATLAPNIQAIHLNDAPFGRNRSHTFNGMSSNVISVASTSSTSRSSVIIERRPSAASTMSSETTLVPNTPVRDLRDLGSKPFGRSRSGTVGSVSSNVISVASISSTPRSSVIIERSPSAASAISTEATLVPNTPVRGLRDLGGTPFSRSRSGTVGSVSSNVISVASISSTPRSSVIIERRPSAASAISTEATLVPRPPVRDPRDLRR